MIARFEHALLAAVLIAAAPALAQEAPVLSVTSDGETRVLTIADLSALPVTSFETSTIWTEGTHAFEGILLADLMEAMEMEGETVVATALNDYAVEIPVAEITDEGPIVAYRMDGAEMSRRGKGPFWILYPFDDVPEFRSETAYSRSVWQLDRLSITD